MELQWKMHFLFANLFNSKGKNGRRKQKEYKRQIALVYLIYSHESLLMYNFEIYSEYLKRHS